jgi:hypothetical protein
MSQNFELKKKGIKKIVVENTTCRIYGRKKKLRKKCPHFGHNIDFFLGMMDNDAKYFNIEVGVP